MDKYINLVTLDAKPMAEEAIYIISTHSLTMDGIKEIRIPLSEAEYMDISTKKEMLGLTWRDLLSQGTDAIFMKRVKR